MTVVQKKFISFKDPLGFYKNMKDGYATLEKAEENFKKIQSDLDEIWKWQYESKGQKKCNKKN